jgi:hypothetical protein
MKREQVSSSVLSNVFKYRVLRMWKTVPINILQSKTLSSLKANVRYWLHQSNLNLFNKL